MNLTICELDPPYVHAAGYLRIQADNASDNNSLRQRPALRSFFALSICELHPIRRDTRCCPFDFHAIVAHALGGLGVAILLIVLYPL